MLTELQAPRLSPAPEAAATTAAPAASTPASAGDSQAPAGTLMTKPELATATTAAVDTEMQIKAEEGVVATDSAQAAASLISAGTQAVIDKPPSMQSMLEDGQVFMPAMPADLQAELASSASSSFNAAATFGTMQQQLSSTFQSSPVLAGDFAADLFSSPGFALVDDEEDYSTAAVGITGPSSTIMNASYNAAAGKCSRQIQMQMRFGADTLLRLPMLLVLCQQALAFSMRWSKQNSPEHEWRVCAGQLTCNAPSVT